MVCRSCGMDSKRPDVCEWCKKPMAGGQAATGRGQPLNAPLNAPPAAPLHAAPLNTPPPPPVTKQMRVSLTGEVIEEEVPVAPPPPAVGMPGAGAAPIAAHAGLPVGAITTQMIQHELPSADAMRGENWEKFLAIGLPLLLAGVAVVHFAPAAYLWVYFGILFVGTLILGATAAIPSYDDAFADCALALGLSYIFGPGIALAACFVIGLVRQEWNSAVMGVLTVIVTVQTVFALTFPSNAQGLKTLLQVSMMPTLTFFAVCCAFAGWILSSFFRPMDAA